MRGYGPHMYSVLTDLKIGLVLFISLEIFIPWCAEKEK